MQSRTMSMPKYAGEEDPHRAGARFGSWRSATRRSTTSSGFRITESPELELTYNFETLEGGYELGTGYGHIALTIDDLDGTLARLEEKGIEPERPPYTVR